jgi:hypothetical protein
MRIDDQGSIVVLYSETEDESVWLTDNTNAEPWQFLGRGLAVDYRFAEDLITGVINAGFEIKNA